MYLKASDFAGIAFGNSGCAAVHAMSYALGGKYHVPHGESNYQFFTDVLNKYQEKQPEGKIRELEEMIRRITNEAGYMPGSPAMNGIRILESLLSKVLEKKPMSAFGAVQEDIRPFAESTVENQQRLLKNNYVPLSTEEIEEIYQARLQG